MEENTMFITDETDEATELTELARWRLKNKIAAVFLSLSMIVNLVMFAVLFHSDYDVVISFLFFFCRLILVTCVAGLINKWYIEAEQRELPIALIWFFIDLASYVVEFYVLGIIPW